MWLLSDFTTNTKLYLIHVISSTTRDLTHNTRPQNDDTLDLPLIQSFVQQEVGGWKREKERWLAYMQSAFAADDGGGGGGDEYGETRKDVGGGGGGSYGGGGGVNERYDGGGNEPDDVSGQLRRGVNGNSIASEVGRGGDVGSVGGSKEEFAGGGSGGRGYESGGGGYGGGGGGYSGDGSGPDRRSGMYGKRVQGRTPMEDLKDNHQPVSHHSPSKYALHLPAKILW